MAVTIKSSGPRGAKTYEIRVDGALYDYTDNAYAARKIAARARAEQRAGQLDRYGNKRRNPRRNPTKAQKREAAKKTAVKRRVAVALAKYLKQQNPGAKLAGAKVEKLKGGVLKITPIKANSWRAEYYYELRDGDLLLAYADTKAEAEKKAKEFRKKGHVVKIRRQHPRM